MQKGGFWLIIEYEINSSTLIIFPIDNKKCRIVESDLEFFVNKKSTKVIEESCLFFGCSYLGRVEGTKKLINVAVKAPIIVEESKKIIFFPTSSPRLDTCMWISYNNLVKYTKNNDNNTILYFKNNQEIEIDVSYNIIDNKIVRCIKLEKELIRRKKVIK